MEEWQKLLADGVNRSEDLKILFPGLDEKQLKAVAAEYPLRINRYYLDLIKDPDDPIGRQVIPSVDEVTCRGCGIEEDPLSEEEDSVVPGLVHRYPDRALLYVNYQCPIYCRYCTRKRKIGNPGSLTRKDILAGIRYIREHKEVRDVVLSGGDPLLLKDAALADIVGRLRAIRHVEVIRIGTRCVSALPQRITQKLCDVLKPHHPVYIMVHFTHPREITPEVEKACALLADNGFPMMNQSVLLRGINDDPAVFKKLFQQLLRLRVRPYYLYQCDLTAGAAHFRTSLRKGLHVMENLRGHTSGLAVPYFVIDAPGGGGKIPVLPEYLLKEDEKEVVLRNYEGRIFRYALPQEYGEEEVRSPVTLKPSRQTPRKKRTRRKDTAGKKK